ncbi:S1C family serine protease [Halorientalis brevis]|uniref:S1C family serine protease n=1 Tax=Halorientalis brevis TaxID=1126241 RepID=A0ABD6CDA3_9EURY|nr:trypsin-like peptidase domain-containing protein [Halorientalis brevis]
MKCRIWGVLLVVVVASTGVGTGVATGRQATPQQAGCDYVSLYDETIDSVVSIQTPIGQGSGFVYRKGDVNDSSYVVTNAHVVGDAEEVLVRFSQGQTVAGTVVGSDVFADLAVVRVNQTPGYADALAVAEQTPPHGQKVAALGNPFGLEETITHGIISGVNRTLPTVFGFSIPSVVQTDTPISPGNSGGPLVTCQGEVVGINTAGIASAGAENIGFAVPSTVIDAVVPTLTRTGEYEHGFLGVSTTQVTPPLVAANNFSVSEGAYVVSTVQGTPAADKLRGASQFTFVNGTRVPVGGDVIVSVDGRDVDSGEVLTSYLFTHVRAGENVTLTVVRDGERRQVNVTLAERPELPEQQPPVTG